MRDTGSEDMGLCLEFIETVDWRTSSHAKDRLTNYSDLVLWSQRKGLVDEKGSERLLRLGASEESGTEKVLEQAKAFREAMYRIFSASAHGLRPSVVDVQVLNRVLRRAMAQLEVQPTESGYRLGWCPEERADSMLYPLAKSAADLLTSQRLGRVRECANEEDGCGSLFIDTSKSHSRRWCSMDSCGNKVKLRTYYQRHKMRESGGNAGGRG